jgi:hypothetical protein
MNKQVFAIFAALALFCSSAQAVRVLEILERSYELGLADVTLPQSANGQIGFKSCDTCARQYMPVSASTRYFLQGQPVTLTQLGQEANHIRNNAGAADRTMVVLHYDPETEVATRIRVDTL